MSDIGHIASDLICQAAEKIAAHVADNAHRTNRIKDTLFLPTREQIMEVVFSHPQGIMLKDVAQKVSRTPGAVSQIIETLVREGMVERLVSKHDRRAVTLYATNIGNETRAAVIGRIDSLMTSIMQTVPPNDRIVFLKTLRHIVKELASDTEKQ